MRFNKIIAKIEVCNLFASQCIMLKTDLRILHNTKFRNNRSRYSAVHMTIASEVMQLEVAATKAWVRFSISTCTAAMAIPLAVCETFIVKEWRDLEQIGLWAVQSH